MSIAQSPKIETVRKCEEQERLPRTRTEAFATFLGRASPQILIAALLWNFGWRLAMGHWRWLDLWVTIGLVAYWPVHEWLTHAFVLHNPPRSLGPRIFDYRVAQKHREHHADPWNLDLVFVPLHVYPLVMPVLVAGALWLAPDTRIAMTCLTVYSLLSLNYEWTHYLAHIHWCPAIGYYARRVRDHRLHHFRDDTYWWGVSMGGADRWFGTARRIIDAGDEHRRAA